MTEQEMIATYRTFIQGKDADLQTLRHEMMVSHDKGSMSHFIAFLAEKYKVSKMEARAIYKCLYYETWIGDLKND